MVSYDAARHEIGCSCEQTLTFVLKWVCFKHALWPGWFYKKCLFRVPMWPFSLCHDNQVLVALAPHSQHRNFDFKWLFCCKIIFGLSCEHLCR
jgi:hypothetical protein